MKPKSIGIVGGAGPLAGASLLERVLRLSGSAYGCYRDGDFPKVLLLSFPFSEMLTPGMDVAQLQNELSQCLKQLRENGAAVLAIACNTLHAFLNEDEELTDFIHMPKELAMQISPAEIPLVLCTTTSKQFGLHRRFFRCAYPDDETQGRVDNLISQILKGTEQQVVVGELREIIESQTASTIILGCTELSLFANHIAAGTKTIIDPLDVVAEKILEKTFSS